MAPVDPVGPVGPVPPVPPVAPVSPVGPVPPAGPAAPVGPVAPCGPVLPVGPVTPTTPVAPVAPGPPCGPVAPAAPVGPVAPETPFGPVAPVGPVGPVGPAWVTGPRNAAPASEALTGPLLAVFGSGVDESTVAWFAGMPVAVALIVPLTPTLIDAPLASWGRTQSKCVPAPAARTVTVQLPPSMVALTPVTVAGTVSCTPTL